GGQEKSGRFSCCGASWNKTVTFSCGILFTVVHAALAWIGVNDSSFSWLAFTQILATLSFVITTIGVLQNNEDCAGMIEYTALLYVFTVCFTASLLIYYISSGSSEFGTGLAYVFVICIFAALATSDFASGPSEFGSRVRIYLKGPCNDHKNC
ncbi:hypothetical protein PFISCL1PPCAC_5258, partial [Pristionchus fissidentatus]